MSIIKVQTFIHGDDDDFYYTLRNDYKLDEVAAKNGSYAVYEIGIEFEINSETGEVVSTKLT